MLTETAATLVSPAERAKVEKIQSAYMEAVETDQPRATFLLVLFYWLIEQAAILALWAQRTKVQNAFHDSLNAESTAEEVITAVAAEAIERVRSQQK